MPGRGRLLSPFTRRFRLGFALLRGGSRIDHHRAGVLSTSNLFGGELCGVCSREPCGKQADSRPRTIKVHPKHARAGRARTSVFPHAHTHALPRGALGALRSCARCEGSWREHGCTIRALLPASSSAGRSRATSVARPARSPAPSVSGRQQPESGPQAPRRARKAARRRVRQ